MNVTTKSFFLQWHALDLLTFGQLLSVFGDWLGTGVDDIGDT